MTQPSTPDPLPSPAVPPKPEPRTLNPGRRPRFIYYNDAHHFHAKRIEPPATMHKLWQPIDELVGTGVDAIAFSLGYGDVYFHNSKVGRVVGQEKEVWDSYIDWRIMRMVQEGPELGTDQLEAVITRGHQLGITVFASLKVNDPSPPGDERCGWLKWRHGADVCIGGEGPGAWYYDYANDLVRQEKLAMVREVLEDYRADGIQLYFGGPMFKPGEVEKNVPILDRFVADVKALCTEIGRKQGRWVPVMVHLGVDREENLRAGLDVETWLRQGSVDFVVGEPRYRLFETARQPQWLPDAANAVGAAAYYRPPQRRIYDERMQQPDIETYRALAQILREQGYAGIYEGYYSWPLDAREYQILREVPYPEIIERRNKRYLTQPREGKMGGPTTTLHRDVPAELKEGETATVTLYIADDIDAARQSGELRKPQLTIRFAFFCVEDEIEVRFNGRTLDLDEAEVTDERALVIPVQMRRGMDLQAPMGMSAHWFRWLLPLDLIRHGENVVEVETKRQSPTAGFSRSINGVEIEVRYNEFTRPQGLEVERIAPQN